MQLMTRPARHLVSIGVQRCRVNPALGNVLGAGMGEEHNLGHGMRGDPPHWPGIGANHDIAKPELRQKAPDRKPLILEFVIDHRVEPGHSAVLPLDKILYLPRHIVVSTGRSHRDHLRSQFLDQSGDDHRQGRVDFVDPGAG